MLPAFSALSFLFSAVSFAIVLCCARAGQRWIHGHLPRAKCHSKGIRPPLELVGAKSHIGHLLEFAADSKTGRWSEATHLAQVKPRPDSLHYFHLRQHIHFSIIIRAFARKTRVSPSALHRPPCRQHQKRPHSPQARQKNAKTGRRLHLAPRPAMRQPRPTSSPPRSRLRHWSKVPAPQEAQDR